MDHSRFGMQQGWEITAPWRVTVRYMSQTFAVWVKDQDAAFRRGSLDSMPFPPGVGGGRGTGDANGQNYDVITADRAINENNVGNRMLRNMGWNEGSGLAREGSGIVEPVQAQALDGRGGLGSQPKKLDPSLEVQAGDSYKTLIQKKAIARFREMS